MMTTQSMPYLRVSRGRLHCTLPKGPAFHYSATLRGARAMGRRLRALGWKAWLCSSTVDHAQDEGGQDADLRAALEDAWIAAGRKKAPSLEPLLRRLRKTDPELPYELGRVLDEVVEVCAQVAECSGFSEANADRAIAQQIRNLRR